MVVEGEREGQEERGAGGAGGDVTVEPCNSSCDPAPVPSLADTTAPGTKRSDGGGPREQATVATTAEAHEPSPTATEPPDLAGWRPGAAAVEPSRLDDESPWNGETTTSVVEARGGEGEGERKGGAGEEEEVMVGAAAVAGRTGR